MNADYDYLEKIVLCGSSGAGKTSLLQQYVDRSFQEVFISTIGVDFKFKNITLQSGKVAKLQLWDTAGQDRFKSIVASYWRGANGVVFIFDVTSQESFDSITKWVEEVDHYVNPAHKVQKLLVGNKCDLAHKRVVPYHVAENLARTLGMAYIETSAKTQVGVDQAFTQMAEAVALNYQVFHGSKPKPGLPERPSRPIDESSCCTIS